MVDYRLLLSYRKRGKIRWAKLSRIPPNVVFHGKTIVVPYVYNIKTTRERHYMNIDRKLS